MPWLPPPGFVDLRSDTVTKPSPEMREAMRAAEVGNAAFGEDPTVLELEAKSAKIVGKEAALYVPSGTMGNQVLIRALTARTTAPEVICEARAHIYMNEAAALATVSHAQARLVHGVRGALPADAVEAAIHGGQAVRPQTALIAMENTHNYASGAVIPLAAQRAVKAVADGHGLPVHLDGARLFNAAVALACDPREIARDATTVQFCFSKGLGAPVGSVACGPADVIREASKVRSYLGGAMRQAGVIAAAALVGLEKERHRLAEDHARAKRLWKGLADVPGLRIVEEPDTNILVMDVSGAGMTANEFAAELRDKNVGFSVISRDEARAVTHRDVDDDGIEAAIHAVRDVLRARR